MLRILTRLAVVLVGLLALTVGLTGPASAADAAGCRIAPGYTFTFEPFCVNDKAAAGYSVAFHAPAGPSGGAWTVTGDWTSVVTGCGPADDYCTVRTGGSGADRVVEAWRGGYYSYAYIRAYCSWGLC